MKYLLSILCLFVFSCDDDSPEFCTDETACNFNEEASCLYELSECLQGTWELIEISRYENYEMCYFEDMPDDEDDQDEKQYLIFYDDKYIWYNIENYNGISNDCINESQNFIEQTFCEDGFSVQNIDYTIQGIAYNDDILLLHDIFFEKLQFLNGYDEECLSCDDENCYYLEYDYCVEFDGNPASENSYMTRNIESMNYNDLVLLDIDGKDELLNNDEKKLNCHIATFNRVTGPLSIEGCMDPNFLNFNPYATYNDGNCSNNECPE